MDTRIYHTPVNVTMTDSLLATRYATCSQCGEAIESWELEDDDMGIFWTKWGIRKGAALLNKSCSVGVSA